MLVYQEVRPPQVPTNVEKAGPDIRCVTPKETQEHPKMDLSLLEARRTIDRFYKQQDHLMSNAGHGSIAAAMAITEEYIGVLSEAIEAKLASNKPNSHYRQFVIMLRELGAPLLALAALQTCLHSIGMAETFRSTLTRLGRAVQGEAWAAKLTQDNPKLAASITKYAKRKYSSTKMRVAAARNIAGHAGFKQKHWKPTAQVQAGAWLLDVVLEALPAVFHVGLSQNGLMKEQFLGLTEGAEAFAEQAVSELILRQPVFLPMTTPPVPWSSWAIGGPKDQRANYSSHVLRSRWKDVEGRTKHAIRSGQMAPALDALNSLQSVPWKINTKVLVVLQTCIEQGVPIPGLPCADILPPAKVGTWEDMTEGEQKLWRLKADRTKAKNRSLVGERLMLVEDMQTATLFSNDTFYTPMNLDWRGRVYSMCQFHFQREDRVRALFQFANGEPIGTEGLWWLKVHVANCGDFDKISKRPLEERVAWVDQNIETITKVATAPIECLSKWTTADKPFLYLAACLELVAALQEGPRFVTHLPVSFDGSCSGLQHLCAMTRAPEGQLVNLTANDLPQDVYATVAAHVSARIVEDAQQTEVEEGKEWVPIVAQLALDMGIDRKVTKRNVMTYSYSSKRFGMASQQQTDLMDVLDEEVLTGQRENHPFREYAEGRSDRPSTAARYLANHVYAAIEEIINLPAQAMAFLQECSKALAHEGKPLVWVTPSGIPWINRYHEPKLERLTLWMHDKGVKVKHKVVVAEGNKNEISKSKVAAGVAPNFVHALDASHLSLTVNAANREGILAIATVHDSFGCLASQAGKFNRIIREEFARMYTDHDVLAEILAQAKCDLTPANWDKLPSVPQYGSLDINAVKQAQFAFA